MGGFVDIWKRSGGVFLVMLAFVGILPVLITGVLSPQKFALATRADESTPIRIWFEPTTTVVGVGNTFSLDVMAEYRDRFTILPQVLASVTSDAGVTLRSSELQYKEPFSGTVRLGVIQGEAVARGTHYLQIPKEAVKTIIPDLTVVSAKAEIIVK